MTTLDGNKGAEGQMRSPRSPEDMGHFRYGQDPALIEHFKSAGKSVLQDIDLGSYDAAMFGNWIYEWNNAMDRNDYETCQDLLMRLRASSAAGGQAWARMLNAAQGRMDPAVWQATEQRAQAGWLRRLFPLGKGKH